MKTRILVVYLFGSDELDEDTYFPEHNKLYPLSYGPESEVAEYIGIWWRVS